MLWPYNRAPRYIADPGAGTGVWGQAAKTLWKSSHITGFENGPFNKDAQFYAAWHGDWLKADGKQYDLVMGNPPFKIAEACVRQALSRLRPNGVIIMFLRLAFLESETRMNGLWKEHPPRAVYVLGKRPSFTGDGKTDAAAYALYLWTAPSSEKFTPALKWLDW